MHDIIGCAKDFGVRGVEMMNFCEELHTPDMRGFCYEEIGRGAIDFARLSSQLRARGYNGLYSIEFEGVKDMDEVARVISFLEKALA